ncbi:hypothetical protein B194_2195 [Serratia plymuthica A30]|nr:hypothetical protein B194_2195 [Serratia plymuthica A30]
MRCDEKEQTNSFCYLSKVLEDLFCRKKNLVAKFGFFE